MAKVIPLAVAALAVVGAITLFSQRQSGGDRRSEVVASELTPIVATDNPLQLNIRPVEVKGPLPADPVLRSRVIMVRMMADANTRGNDPFARAARLCHTLTVECSGVTARRDIRFGELLFGLSYDNVVRANGWQQGEVTRDTIIPANTSLLFASG